MTRSVSGETVLLLLDTTVLIDYLRGRAVVERVGTLVEHGEVLCTSPVNVEEVVRGLRPGEISAADDLFDGLRVVPIGRPEGRQAGEWRRRFAARGTTLSQADCLVAAAAHATAAVLATGNPKHFPMNEIEVEHWPVGK